MQIFFELKSVLKIGIDAKGKKEEDFLLRIFSVVFSRPASQTSYNRRYIEVLTYDASDKSGCTAG